MTDPDPPGDALPKAGTAHASRLPKQIGRYIVERELGAGGMGAVYAATDPLLERRVAIKVLGAHLTQDQEFVARFIREARAAARILHPNIVTIYEVGHDDAQHFFAMEYIDGQPLDVALAELPSATADVAARLSGMLPYLRQVASGLDEVHTAGMVHRDVKPANILVTAAGRVVVTDFGVVAGGDGPRLTTVGSLLGTPAYMAPEQVLGDAIGPAVDEYALAIVAYELLTGKPPFQGPPTAVLHAHAFQPPPLIAVTSAQLSVSLNVVFTRALAKRPEVRFPTATALIDALEDALNAAAPHYTTMLSSRCAACGARRPSDATYCPGCGAHAGLGAPGIARRVQAALTDFVLCLDIAGFGIVSVTAHVPPVLRLLLVLLGASVVGCVAMPLLWVTTGRTFGMWLAGIGLVTVSGKPLRPGQAVVRYLMGLIGLPMLLFARSAHRQALDSWHDRAVGTRVVGPPDRPGQRRKQALP